MIPEAKHHQGDSVLYYGSVYIVIQRELAYSPYTGEFMWAYHVVSGDGSDCVWVNDDRISPAPDPTPSPGGEEGEEPK